MIKNTALFFLIFCFPIASIADSICASGTEQMIPATTPTNQFSFDEDDDVVTDIKTGLMWSRCPVGYTWGNDTCNTDSDQTMGWLNALDFVSDNKASDSPYLSFSDWRLPNIKELASIIERRCLQPSVNQYIFGVDAFSFSYYWSNTHYIGTGNMRVVSFYNAALGSAAASNDLLVRLVRDVTTP